MAVHGGGAGTRRPVVPRPATAMCGEDFATAGQHFQTAAAQCIDVVVAVRLQSAEDSLFQVFTRSFGDDGKLTRARNLRERPPPGGAASGRERRAVPRRYGGGGGGWPLGPSVVWEGPPLSERDG